MGKAQSKSMNVTTADQAKAGAVEEGAGKVGKIEEVPAASTTNGDANHETVSFDTNFLSVLTLHSE